MAFLDLEKALDRVDRNMLRQDLNKRGFPHHLIKTVESLCKNTSVQIDTGTKILEKFVINQGLRQGCSLSRALFNTHTNTRARARTHEICRRPFKKMETSS
jgi:NAD(P)H-nitrite reductase large subunit